ncbi:ABC transporter substrate-binding protein [Dysosmobacter sp. NSJ-60]|nr:ABC transporter substrate-binding protein [Dysosmobacter hominis]
MRKYNFATFMFILAIMLGLVGCGGQTDSDGSDSNDGEKLYIGMALPLTGESAMYGETVRDGVQFAVDEINEAGGIGGKQIELVIEDDKGNTSEAAMVAQKLSEDDRLFCVIGHVNSSCTLVGIPIYADAGLTLLNTSSSAANITQQGFTNFFRTVISDDLQAPMMVRHVTENLGLNKIALMVPNSDYGLGLLEGTESSAAENNVEIVASEMYVPNQDKDFSVQLAKIKQAEPEALLILGDYNEAGLIIKQMDAAGMGEMPIVTTASCSNQIMIDLAGAEAAEGVFMLGYWDPDRPEDIVQNFVTAWAEKHDGAVPDERNAYGYEIPYIIKQAIEEYGATRETLPDVLREKVEYTGPTGLNKFDENGDVTEKMQMVFIVHNGKFTSWVKDS